MRRLFHQGGWVCHAPNALNLGFALNTGAPFPLKGFDFLNASR